MVKIESGPYDFLEPEYQGSIGNKKYCHRVIKREESEPYDSLEPGYHGSIGNNYFVTEWSRGESGHMIPWSLGFKAQ